MPPQDGAPIRLVVPWKYGFKGIKSIVKIKLVPTSRATTWSDGAERVRLLRQRESARAITALEPGDRTAHRRTGSDRRPTLMFNGYEEEVAHLYAGMDLKRYF